jgi:hypothetical protein
MPLSRLVDEFAAPELTTTTPLLLITIGEWEEGAAVIPGGRLRPGIGFKRAWVDPRVLTAEIDLVAAATCCWWSSLRGRNVEGAGVEHLVAVYHGVTRALFEVVPGSWEMDEEDARGGCQVRAVLSGSLWERVVGRHGHRTMVRGSRRGWMYWPR